MSKEQELYMNANKEIEKRKYRIDEDYYRLNYHLMPPVGFMNDPNGFINFKEEYHIFYQFNPFYPAGKKVYWGHYKSSDLINWQPMPIALCPSEWYETHGCYSGSAVSVDGKMTLMYTGNVKDENNNRETYQCLAHSSDGITFTKNENNPVICNQPKGYTRHFRDPKVWRHNGLWYMVLGAQTEALKGTALIYSSEDLKEWSMLGEAAGSNNKDLSFLGYMWECPNIFSVDGEDILMFCPQGVEAQGDLYNNIYQCGYLMGKLNYETGKLSYGEFIELDRGFEFYAPQITKDIKGRTLISGWMGLPEEEEAPTAEKGWLHCLTMMRELKIKERKLIQLPIEETKLLRKKEISYSQVIASDESVSFEGICGDSYELLCNISWEKTESFGIRLRCNSKLQEETLIYYSSGEEKLVLDRNRSGMCKQGIRRCGIKNNGKLNLRIFMDKSSIEIFVNEGEEVFTSRIYPSKESQGIEFFSIGGEIDLDINFWQI